MTENNLSSQSHTIKIDGASYYVTSNYIGKIPLLELFKQMLKRDIERLEN